MRDNSRFPSLPSLPVNCLSASFPVLFEHTGFDFRRWPCLEIAAVCSTAIATAGTRLHTCKLQRLSQRGLGVSVFCFFCKQITNLQDRGMHPDDAPYGTLRHRLICCLTSIEPLSKRLAGELLWTICDGDGDSREVQSLPCRKGSCMSFTH